MSPRRKIRSWLIAAALAAGFAAPFGCSDNNHPLPGSSAGGGGGIGGVAIGPCEQGASRACGIKVGEHDGILTCYEGTQACNDGAWGSCTDGTTYTRAAPSPGDQPAGKPLAFTTPVGCTANPCDPYCSTYNEDPDAGITNDASAGFSWQGGNISGLPTAVALKGFKQPCKSAEDCQFNSQCVDPRTSSACKHSKCVTGESMTSTCDPCVQKVCAADPACCEPTVAGSCVHNPCKQGTKLKGAPTPCNADVNTVCAAHPQCCTAYWDASCIGWYETASGTTCNQTWSASCVNRVKTECDSLCGLPGPTTCGHDVCTQGTFLDQNCNACVAKICSVDPACCENTGGWNATCVQETATVCGLTCPVNMASAPSEVGKCTPWLPGQTDPSCSGFDLGLGVTCDDTVVVCNHGTTVAPAGIDVIHFPPATNEFGKAAPNQGLVAGTCTTTLAIGPGKCTSIPCTGMSADSEIMVNPPGATQVTECTPGASLDNWAYYVPGTCGAPLCTATTTESVLKKVNMYFMVDKSGSMGGTKWTGTTSALNTFFQSNASAGLGVALEFFRLDSGGANGDGCPGTGSVCTDVPCSNPRVTLGTLTTATGAADPAEDALVTAVNATSPGGSTPTYPALKGALDWAIAKQAAAPDEIFIVILATDGDASECNTNPTAMSSLSGSAYLTYGIRTYVIGMQGANYPVLDQIATAGGTGSAFQISGSSGAAVAASLITTLTNIANQTASCSTPLPPAGNFDPTNVTIQYTPSSGAPSSLPQVTDASACSGPGWYYDDPTNPSQIILCPTSCTAAQSDPGAKIIYNVGCPTLYNQSDTLQYYEAVCPSGSKPQWGYLTWDTTTPSDSSVDFQIRTATTQPGLSLKTQALAGTAVAAPTNTQVCTLSTCYVDLYTFLGLPDAKLPWLELQLESEYQHRWALDTDRAHVEHLVLVSARRIIPLLVLCFPIGCSGDDGHPSGPGLGGGNNGGTGGLGGSAGGGLGGVSGGGTGGTPAECGNNVQEGGENCDGTDLTGATCVDIGFDTGTLTCNADCTWDKSACVGTEKCVDGIDNDGDDLVDCDDTDCAPACADACTTPMALADPAVVNGTTAGHGSKLDASCSASPSGPEVAYAFTAKNTGIVEAKVTSFAGLSVAFRTTCSSVATELGCANDVGLTAQVTAGQQLFVIVDGATDTQFGPFQLEIESRTVTCGDGHRDLAEQCDDGGTQPNDGCSATCTLEASESEPNDAVGQADSLTSPFYGQISPTGDVDYIQLNISAAQAPASIVIEGFDLGDGACSKGEQDSYITLYASNGTTVVAEDDDSGALYCAKLSATGLAAGTYYIAIKAAGATPTFPYKIDPEIDQCGNGTIGAAETCDDSNTTSGDGCSASCSSEN